MKIFGYEIKKISNVPWTQFVYLQKGKKKQLYLNGKLLDSPMEFTLELWIQNTMLNRIANEIKETT